MKKLILVLSLIALTGCYLKPAPITSLDVRGTLGGLSPDETVTKGNEILSSIASRKEELNRKKRNYNIAIYANLWAPLMVAGPIYLCQRPARKQIGQELLLLTEKEQVTASIIKDAGRVK